MPAAPFSQAPSVVHPFAGVQRLGGNYGTAQATLGAGGAVCSGVSAAWTATAANSSAAQICNVNNMSVPAQFSP